MNLRLSLRILVLAGCISLMAAGAAFAQTSGIDLSPSISNPIPGQTVTVTARSYSTNINAASVVWTVNGRVVKKGIGVTSIDVVAPAAGKTLSIVADATSPEGINYENTLVLSSGSIDLIVEPQGYVPPMFGGKIPFVYQGTAVVTAMPHLANSSGVEYDPKTLIYKWEQGSTILEDQSGYGHQSVTVQGGIIPRPIQLTVTATTRGGGAVASQSLTIAPSAPFLAFYRNDPLYGPLYNLALGSSLFLGTEREAGVLAVPFGFNVPASDLGTLNLDWSINGSTRSELDQNRSITLRAPADTAGSSDVSLTVTDTKNILQSAAASFQAVFSASSNTSQNKISF